MTSSPQAEAEWQNFVAEPVAYIDPARFADCFDGAISPALSEKLQQSQRLQSRLSAIVRGHYGLASWADPAELDNLDRAIALSPLPQLATLAKRSGAIYWSAVIANTVLAKAVAALQQHLGDELCSFAIGNRDLAGPAKLPDPPGDIGRLVQEDGWRCFAAWCDTLPEGIGARVRLKLPKGGVSDEPVSGVIAEKGPAIMRRAAE